MTVPTGNPTDFESFLTWEALTAVLSYDPAKGEFRWVKNRPGHFGWAGRLAGTIDITSGYRRIKILGRSFFASRLAWLYMTKKWPARLVDHKNGNPGDDRWVNLREAGHVENGRNHKVHSNNKTGVNGVYWDKALQKWVARFRDANGKRVFLGAFVTVDEAVAARKGAEAAYFGEFRREASERAVPPVEATRSEPVVEKPKKAPRRGVISDFESFLTHETLIEILSYNPANGEFVWRSNQTNPLFIKVGRRAGDYVEGEYSDLTIMGRKFRAHRIAWLYMTGRWPRGVVDHVNGVKSDNRWENLREATRGQNAHNRPMNKNNTSGRTGVYFRSDTNKWRAIIRHDGKVINLGNYATSDEAATAHKKFEDEFLSEFINRSA